MPLTVTFIRHGESLDNPRGIWAGWKDAPLSPTGNKQALAVGKSMASTKLDFIYASPLLRARSTGEAVHSHQPSPQPPFTVNPNLREQHFGIAEGHHWTFERPKDISLEQLFAEGIFPVLYERHEKFPEGESLDDLARRSDLAVKECILPHLKEDGADVHVALASHGLAISELVAALLRLDPDSDRSISYAGLRNTAWTRAVVSVRDKLSGPINVDSPPSLTVKITNVNEYGHLADLPSVPDTATDEKAAKARAFFGGEKPTGATNAGRPTERL